MAGKVGFIGLGAMGGPMALNLVKHGFQLVVHDIDPTKVAVLAQAGAAVEPTPATVAAASDRTISMVETTDQAESVIIGDRGIIERAQHGHIVLCMSTIDPFAARRVEPPDLIESATACAAFIKEMGPDEPPPLESGSSFARKGERLTPLPEPFLNTIPSVLIQSRIDSIES